MPGCPCLYTEIYDDDDMNVCIFTLRNTGSEIPLHDHPDITGLIKVIFGSARVTSYSWLKPEHEDLIKVCWTKSTKTEKMQIYKESCVYTYRVSHLSIRGLIWHFVSFQRISLKFLHNLPTYSEFSQ